MKAILFILTMASMTNAYGAKASFQSLSNSGRTHFEAVGKPAMIKIKGESPAPKSTLTFTDGKASLEAELMLDQLKTGIDLRDEHMKEKYLEVKKHPTAKLVINSLNLPSGWETNPSKVSEQPFKGTLTLHGKEAPVEGVFSFNDKKEANAEFKIKLSDYNIELPDYMGIKVAELVTIKTQLQFEKL